VFQDVTQRAKFPDFSNRLGRLIGGHYDHGGIGIQVQELPQNFGSTHKGQIEIQQDDVRPMLGK
jgi:hypothetical protein